MNGTMHEYPPVYPMCNNDMLDVHHMMLKCSQVEELKINNIKTYGKNGKIYIYEKKKIIFIII